MFHQSEGYKVNHNPSLLERVIGYPRLSRKAEWLEREKQEVERQLNNAKTTINNLVTTIIALFIILIVAIIYTTVLCRSYNQYDADDLLYRVIYEDVTPQADNGPTNVLGHVSTTVRYGLATADPNKLWDLERAYNNNVMIVLDTTLQPCGVYLITTDSEGQSTTTPVPSDQVPPKYDGFVAGCDPELLVPWWVTDQFAEPEFKPNLGLPIREDGCNVIRGTCPDGSTLD